MSDAVAQIPRCYTRESCGATAFRARGWWVMLEACLRHGRAQRKNHSGAPKRRRVGMTSPLLTVEDLRVAFEGDRGTVTEAVAGVSFSVAPGRTLGIVGE